MPDLFGYDVRDIAKALKIFASIYSMSGFEEAIDKLTDIISANSYEKQTIHYSRKDFDGRRNIIEWFGDKFELWESIIHHINARYGHFYLIPWQKFLENGVSRELFNLIEHIFRDKKCIRLEELLTRSYDPVRYSQHEANVLAFLNNMEDMDEERIIYLYHEIVGVIASAQDKQSLYLRELSEDNESSNEANKGNTLLSHLIDNIAQRGANSLWCTYMLCAILKCDKKYIEYEELLRLLQELDEYPRMQHYIYQILKIIVLRNKNNVGEYDATQKIAESIRKCKNSSYNTKLLELLGERAQYPDSTEDAIKSLAGHEDQQLALQTSFLIKKALFTPKLIPDIIKSIDAISDLGQYLINTSDQNVQRSNLIIDCMYNMGNMDIETDELENYVKLLTKMINLYIDFAKSKNYHEMSTEILNNSNNEFEAIFCMLIKTIYRLALLASYRNVHTQSQCSIDDLLSRLDDLSALAKTLNFSIMPNQIILPNLGSYFLGSVKSGLISCVQDRIGQIVSSMVQAGISNEQLSMANMNNIPERKYEPPYTKLVSNPNVFCDLYYEQNWVTAHIYQIKLHLAHNDRDILSKFNFILNDTEPNFDKAEIVYLFIHFKFDVIGSLEPYMERIYDIFMQSNKRVEYLNKLYELIDLKGDQAQEHLSIIFQKLLEIAAKSIESKFDIVISDIKKLVIRYPNLELNELIMSTLKKLGLKEEKKDILTSLLQQGSIVSIPQGEEQNLQQVRVLDAIHQEKHDQIQSGFEELKNYFIRNFQVIARQSNGIDQEMFGKVNNLEVHEQERLLKIFVELGVIHPKFMRAVSLAKRKLHLFEGILDNKIREFFGIGENDLSIIREQCANLSNLGENKIELSEKIHLFKPYYQFTNSAFDADIIYDLCIRERVNYHINMIKIQADCIEMVQNLFFENFEAFERFKDDIIQLSIKDHENDLICNNTIARRKVESFLEYTCQDVIIDLSRFKSRCDLLLKEKISYDLRQYIEDLIPIRSLLRQSMTNIESYREFINLLQNSKITVDFTKLQYIYPIAFKKIFSQDKGNIKDYLVIEKYVHPDELKSRDDSELDNQFQETYLVKRKDAVVLSFDRYHKIDQEKHGAIVLLCNSRILKFSSDYSKYHILYFVLGDMLKFYYDNVKSQGNINFGVLYWSGYVRTVLKSIKVIDLFNYHAFDLKAGCTMLLQLCACVLLMNKRPFKLDADESKEAIDVIGEVLNKLTKSAFQEFLTYLSGYYTPIDNESYFWEIFRKSTTVPLKSYMYNMLEKTAIHHGCIEEFRNKQAGGSAETYKENSQPLHNSIQKKDRLEQCINHCKNLRYIREEFYPKIKPAKQDFLASYYDFSDEEKIIWRLCSLIRQLHEGKGNNKKRKLCGEIWKTMQFDTMSAQLPADLKQVENPFSAFITHDKLQGISVLLKPALEDPDICKSAKVKNATLINKILKSIVAFLIYVFSRNNANAISAIIDSRSMIRIK